MNDQYETKLDDFRARMYFGMALRDLRRFDEAKAAFDDALLLYPGDRPARIYREMGYMYELKGDVAQAERWYRRAIAADSENAGHYVYLGVMFAKLGRFAEAEEQHRRATECGSGSVDEAHLNLGLVLRAQERYVEAYDCFRAALEIDPRYEHARSALDDLKRVISVLSEV
jgi:tetratricopeptide (TPR) repeat protein